MPEVLFTFEFKRNLRYLAKAYRSIKSDIEPIIKRIENGELPGNKVPGIHLNIFKVRVKNSDIQKGKSSGYRCIYYFKTLDKIILVTIYSKLEQSDISANRIKEIVSEIAL
jgi:mRNA-degrading endonuclease RelE of RelBE toxin-antitoxin system